LICPPYLGLRANRVYRLLSSNAPLLLAEACPIFVWDESSKVQGKDAHNPIAYPKLAAIIAKFGRFRKRGE
jgi:hypothetical protein